MDTAERLLWYRWRVGNDALARDALVARYSPWARLVARSVYMRIYSLRDAWEDCSQNALIGLLESIDRYQPDRGVNFELYARHRVRGAVFNGLRTLRESLAQGNRSHDRAVAIEDRRESLGDDETADPLDAFISTTVGLGLGFLLEAHSVPAGAQQADAYANFEKDQLSAKVVESVEQLPERQQMIVTLHYYHHVPFVQIAAQLGVTKGRISQLHKQALERLRAYLKERVHTEL
ncbi:sigma-70 family RNA polymerase sigma factor [Dyella tabacisoli]|uniref:sigma-70 family RNA polymerase sigma factor n=1 Tax=Dyella tabacisoli TaxID=2282381 RepID=UPI0013B3F607